VGVSSGASRVLADVAAADELLVIRLDGKHRDEPDQLRRRRGDPDDVRASGDVAIEALKRIRRADLWQCSAGEAYERQHVCLGLLEKRGDLRLLPLELADGVAQLGGPPRRRGR
jgi:hypothetical protein